MMRLFGILCVAAVLFMTGRADAIDDLAEGQSLAKKCADCHGPVGESRNPLHPNLAGQKSAYIERQIKAIRNSVALRFGGAATERLLMDSSRRNPSMAHLTLDLSDRQIHNIAKYYEFLPCAPAQHTGVTRLPRVARQCTVCHSVTGVSEKEDVPNLASQKREYLIQEISEFRDAAEGIKTHRRSTVMEAQVGKLSLRQIERIAGYFAGQSCEARGR